MQSRKQSGFTLVEILIVVIILGILAAIVIPQFTNAGQDASASSLVSQLQTIRGQLELYQVQHNGQYPDLSGGWGPLTAASSPDFVGPGVDADGGDLGPYMQQEPVNAFTGGTAVGTDWDYDQGTGQIQAIITDADVQALLPADAWTDGS